MRHTKLILRICTTLQDTRRNERSYLLDVGALATVVSDAARADFRDGADEAGELFVC